MRSTVSLLLLGLLLATACSAPQRSVQPAVVAASPAASTEAFPEDRLGRARLEAHVRFLASDELMGRAAGTPGEAAAARYIAEQFRAAGALPAGADGYLQPIVFERAPTARGERLRLPQTPGAGAVTGYNVAARIEGRDPERRAEFVVLMAHFDHVGAGMHNGPGATPADSIFNGARDNAMGVAALLGAAEALAARPPARSVLLLALTAEEHGMLGSRYYADHPLVPLAQTVYALNTDGAGYADTSAVTIVGLGRTTDDEALYAAAAAYGVEVVPDPAPEQNLFDRSDNVSFARKGVPAPTISGGFRSFSDPGILRYYHRPQDEVGDFDFDYLRRFAQVFTRAARNVADLPDRPRWAEGDPYEEAARALYGTR